MAYFPDSVYATVFAARQASSVPDKTREPAPRGGLIARLARVFGKANPAGSTLADLGDLFEYHNPTLGVRELGGS